MYDLVIKFENNQPVGHPMLLVNLSLLIPDLDPYNLPEGYRYFERVPRPELKWYEKNPHSYYELVDGIVKDVWHKELMTDEEKAARRAEIDSRWSIFGFASWTFSDETGKYEPPVPYPADGKTYLWDEENRQWVLVEE